MNEDVNAISSLISNIHRYTHIKRDDKSMHTRMMSRDDNDDEIEGNENVDEITQYGM